MKKIYKKLTKDQKDRGIIFSSSLSKYTVEENKVPYIIETEEEKDDFPPFPFPNIGSHIPEGWEKINEYFVDSSGVGAIGELALTAEQFIKMLKVGFGYAITEVGQFQVYVGEYKKVIK